MPDPAGRFSPPGWRKLPCPRDPLGEKDRERKGGREEGEREGREAERERKAS